MNTESNDLKMRKKNKKKKEKNKEKKRKSDKSASVVTKKKHSNEVNQSEVFGKTLKMPPRKVSEENNVSSNKPKEISQGFPEERVQDVEKDNKKLKENLEVYSKVNEKPKTKSKRKSAENQKKNKKRGGRKPKEVEASKKQRSKNKFGDLGVVKGRIASERVARFGNRPNEADPEFDKNSLNPEGQVTHGRYKGLVYNVTDKIKDYDRDDKGKRKRYRSPRRQAPYDQELARASAQPVARKSLNFDRNKFNGPAPKRTCLQTRMEEDNIISD